MPESARSISKPDLFTRIRVEFFLVLLTLLLLVPFLGKPVHVDDPLFLWTAEHIQAHPGADFYGFPVNWYGVAIPISQVAKNPPLISYYMAAVGNVFGWSEFILHLAFLFPAIAVVLGTFRLAREFTSEPLIAALAALFTPVFVVSSSTLMCDVPMLAFWVWAIVFWIRGLAQKSSTKLLIASLLMSACALTKYFGIALIPLLFFYALLQTRRLGTWALFFLIPISVLAGYEWITATLYGRGLLFDAAAYAASEQRQKSMQLVWNTLAALSFTGGSVITMLVFAPWLWSRRMIIVAILLSIAFVAPAVFLEKIGRFPLSGNAGLRWDIIAQLLIFTCAGLGVLALTIAGMWKDRRDSASVFLLLWIIGTFIFAAFLNWSVNSRAILPMAPAIAILLARRFSQLSSASSLRRIYGWIFALAAGFSLWVGMADYRLASQDRNAAYDICARYNNASLWFQGHWGFQYYMQRLGAKPLDTYKSKLLAGDILVTPAFASNNYDLGEDTEKIETLRFGESSWLTTFNLERGAGFYSDLAGPLPFAFGPIRLHEYHISKLKHEVDFPALACAEHFEQGNALYAAGRIHEALLHYREALMVNYDSPPVLTSVAWILSTSPDPQFRDGQQALRLAQHAERLTQGHIIEVLDALAAAYAEIGRFPEAAQTASRALELASKSQQPEVETQIRARLLLYKSGQPHRQ